MKLSAAGVELNGLGEICLLEFEWGREGGRDGGQEGSWALWAVPGGSDLGQGWLSHGLIQNGGGSGLHLKS